MKKHVLSLIIFFVATNAFAQSAWNRDKKSGFFKLSETIIVSDQFYDLDGQIKPITTTGVYITNLYGEYGISEKITGFIYSPFFFRTTLNEQKLTNSGAVISGDELNSVGDTDIGVSYALKQKSSLVLNVSLLLGIPIGNPSGGNTQLLQTGDGEFNQMIKLNAGYSFYPKPFYVSAGIGFNNRTNSFSDELHMNAEIGATLKNFVLSFKLYSRNSFKNGNAEAAQTGIYSNDVEYLAYGPEVSYTFKGLWGISATYQGAANGRNILASPSYSFGVFYKF